MKNTNCDPSNYAVLSPLPLCYAVPEYSGYSRFILTDFRHFVRFYVLTAVLPVIYIAWNVGRVDWYIVTEVAVFRTALIISVKQSNDF